MTRDRDRYPTPEPPDSDWSLAMAAADRPRAVASDGVRPSSSFEIVSLLDFLRSAPPDPAPMIVRGIPAVGLTVLAGSPKIGKSVLAGQVALTVAAGLPTFLEEPTLGDGPVLYIAEEGSRQGLAYRLLLQMTRLGIAGDADETDNARHRLRVSYRQRIRLEDRNSVRRLRAEVEEHRPILAVLDPLNRLHGKDENRPSEMTPVMDALSMLAYDFEMAVLLVHHTTKPNAERSSRTADLIRGAGAIRGASDANLVMLPRGSDGAGLVSLVGEFRDAEPLDLRLELDRESLLFGIDEADRQVGTKLPRASLITLIRVEGAVTAAMVMDRFGVSKNTALETLRSLPGVDVTTGARGQLYFHLEDGS